MQTETPAIALAKFNRPDFPKRLFEFEVALFSIPWIAERILAGQQFNCFERGLSDDEDMDAEDIDDEDREFILCIGPVGDVRALCDIEGKPLADMIEAAMKVATEAFREALAERNRHD